MGILFLILKIIGILLAVLALLVVTVVAVPVRYRISVKAQDGIEGNAVFHWLLHAVDLRLWYGGEGISWKCRILGIPVFRQKGKGNFGKRKKAPFFHGRFRAKAEAQAMKRDDAENKAQALEKGIQEGEAQALEKGIQEGEAQALEKGIQEKGTQALKKGSWEKGTQALEKGGQESEAQALEKGIQEKGAQALEKSIQEKEAQALKKGSQGKEAQSLKGVGGEGAEPSKEQAKRRVVESIKRQKAEIIEYQRGQEGNDINGSSKAAEGRGEKAQQSEGPEGKEITQPSKHRQEPQKGQEAQGQENEKANIFKRVYGFFAKIPKGFQKLRDIAAGGKMKFTAIRARFLNIKTLLLDETNQKAFLHILQELKCLLRHFSPRRASGDIAFSAGDPAQTGEALGILSILPFWAKYQVAIAPDFMAESFFIRGEVFLKGYIRIWHLLPSGVRLIKDKKIHRLIAAMRR